MRFTRAIVCGPGRDFASGLTVAAQGPPDMARALEQHAAYVQSLSECGLTITHAESLDVYPDATFVEDTAILTERGAILARPGAPTRQGEVAPMAETLREFYGDLHRISAPGTVDGGDICQAEEHFLIGVSARTNESGAAQLVAILRRLGYTSGLIDIRSQASLLHLKSGIAYLGGGLWIVDAALEAVLHASVDVKRDDCFVVPARESYAANCVAVNDVILLARGYPQVSAALDTRGLRVVHLEMSEFRKMDGGLSCLSLRF